MSRRAEHRVTLITKEGKEVQATIKKPSVDLSSKMQELSGKGRMLSDQRDALWVASRQINGELAIAELALAHAGDAEKTEATKAVTDARAAHKAIDTDITKKNDAVTELLIEEAQLVVNVPKGDAELAPEIDWRACDIEELSEAINFFLTGKTA